MYLFGVMLCTTDRDVAIFARRMDHVLLAPARCEFPVILYPIATLKLMPLCVMRGRLFDWLWFWHDWLVFLHCSGDSCQRI